MRSLRLLFLVCAVAQPAWGLDPRKSLTQYSLDVWKEGLPQFSIHTLAQTRDGYLWIGTQQGLARFNGATFTIFDTRNTPALKGNVVWALCPDRDGGLWVGLVPGGLAHYKDGRFENLPPQIGLPGALVYALHQDEGGRLWIGTSDGLSVLEAGRISSVPGPSHLAIRALAGDPGGVLYLGTENDGLYRLKGQELSHWSAADGLGSDRVRTLHRDAAGRLWIGTDGAGLAVLEAGRLRRYTAADGLSGDLIRAVTSDRDGNVYVGTFGGGLTRLTGQRIEHLTTSEGLSSDIVFALLEDREGSLWIGSVGGGLDRLKDGTVVTYTRREGLPDNLARAIVDDAAGRVWVATNRGLMRLGAGVRVVLTSRDGLPSDAVFSLWPARDGSVLVGTRNGVARVKDARVVERWELRRDDPVRALFEARDGAVWIGTETALLCRQGQRTRDLSSQVGGRPVYAISQEQTGDILVGTLGGGLLRFHGDDATRFTAREGLATDTVRCASDDGAGNVWLCTDGGLTLWRGGRFTRFGGRHGLPDDVVHAAADDGAGFLWLATNHGIDRVAKKSLLAVAEGKRPQADVLHLDTGDGMLTSECNGDFQPAGWHAKNGRLYFPTVQGVAEIDPARKTRLSDPPAAVIEALFASGAPVPLDSAIALPAGTRNLELHYAGLDFTSPRRLRFRYRLDGFESEWTDAGNRREAYYTNLPPGRYRFDVEVGEQDGRFGTTARLPIVIEARFLESRWFLLLSAIGLLLAGALGHRALFARS